METTWDTKRQEERIRGGGGGGGGGGVAYDFAPIVAPLESRISRDMCNTSRDLAASYATAFNSRTP
jgi:hypothetical protein